MVAAQTYNKLIRDEVTEGLVHAEVIEDKEEVADVEDADKNKDHGDAGDADEE